MIKVKLGEKACERLKIKKSKIFKFKAIEEKEEFLAKNGIRNNEYDIHGIEWTDFGDGAGPMVFVLGHLNMEWENYKSYKNAVKYLEKSSRGR